MLIIWKKLKETFLTAPGQENSPSTYPVPPQIISEPTIQGIVHKATISVANASNVAPDQVEAVRIWHEKLLQRGIAVGAHFTGARVDTAEFNALNLESATSRGADSKTLFADSQQSSLIPALQTTWCFSGKNQLNSLSIHIDGSLQQADFARLHLPTQMLLLEEKTLKLIAHQQLYNQLSRHLAPVNQNAPGNRVILVGAPGLGKSYCAQHYLYHTAPDQHNMVAWLSGSSQGAFDRDWKNLADKFRWMDSELSEVDDTTAIRIWCEQKLGQWLLIIDDVNIEVSYLEQRLPCQGGHVLLTTRHSHYSFTDTESKAQPAVKKLNFLPLNLQDSRQLVEAYFGRYWSNTGHAAEEQAFEQLCTSMGGNPLALAQAALLICKKGLSFRRFMEQFQDTAAQPYLLQDRVFEELSPRQTVTHCWSDSRQSLLNALKVALPESALEELENNLTTFILLLLESGEEGPDRQLLYSVTADHIVATSFYTEQTLTAYQAYLPGYLPIRFDETDNTWYLTSLSIAVLQLLTTDQALSFNVSPLVSKEKEEKIAKDEIDESKTDRVLPPPSLSQGMLDHPVEVKLSLQAGSDVGDISIRAQTENYQQRQEKLKGGWKLPRPNPHFIPRQKLTNELAQKLSPETKDEATQQVLLTTAVTGMGGVGKTELARHFITQHPQSQTYRYRFWLDASTPSRLYGEFRELALYLNLIEQKPYVPDEEMLIRVKRWLSINKGWLLILDNADDYNHIKALIPEVGGCVVVTTRNNRPTLPKERVLAVSVLLPEEAFRWLCQLACRPAEILEKTEKIAVEKLLDKLGYLPLAIAQAAAYLRANPDVLIETYLGQFAALLSDRTLAQEAVAEGEEAAEISKARLAVSSTWHVSLQEIKKHIKHPALLDELLFACAYLAAKDIPLSVLELCFKNAWEGRAREPLSLHYHLDEYLGQLLRYSLVDRNSQTETLSLHNLLQEVMRLQDAILIPEKIFIKRLRPLALLLQELYPYEKQQADYGKARILLPHLESLEKYVKPFATEEVESEKSAHVTEAHLLTAIGDFYFKVFSDPTKALDSHNKALKIRLGVYHIDPLSVAMSYSLAGSVYRDLGKAEESLKYHQEALNIRLTIAGAMSPTVATTYNNIAVAYSTLGDSEKAIFYQKKALAIHLNAYGDLHPNVALDYNNLGITYLELGNYPLAYEYLQNALKIRLDIRGPVHPEVAATRNNLGKICSVLGKYKDALDHHDKALKIYLEVYSELHSSVAMSYGNIGSIHNELGDSKNAFLYHDKSLAINLKIYGDEHPVVAMNYSNIGSTHFDVGDAKKALYFYEKARKINEAIYGVTHASVAIIYENLGRAKQSLCCYKEASAHYEKTLEIKLRIYGTLHASVAATYDNLASLYRDLGSPTIALENCEKALKINLEIYGEAHPTVANNYANLFNIHRLLGNVEQARKCCEKALEINLGIYGDKHPTIAVSYNNLGCLNQTLGRHKEALAYFEQALKIKLGIYGNMHPSIATTYDNLGNTHQALSHLAEARKCFDQSLAIHLEVYDDKHHAVAVSYNNLALINLELSNLKEALAYFTKALDISVALYGDMHSSVATSYGNLGSINKALGYPEEAFKYFKKALKIRLAIYDSEHPDVALSYDNLGSAYNGFGRYNEALDYYKKALAINSKIYGDMHFSVAGDHGCLGRVFSALGQAREGLCHQQNALKIYNSFFGDKHPSVALICSNLGDDYISLGDVNTALVHYKRAFAIYSEVYGDLHPSIATTHNELGHAYHVLGKFKEALVSHKKAFEIRLKVYGEAHPEVATSYNNLGIVYDALNNNKEAIIHYQEALDINVELYGALHPSVAKIYNNFGNYYLKLGEYEKAKDYHENALNIHLKVYKAYNELHPDIGVNYSNLGNVYRELGNYDQELCFQKKALAVFLKLYDDIHPSVATVYGYLGTAHLNLKKVEAAIEYYKKALKIFLSLYGDKHPSLAIIYNDLGQSYIALGNYKEALKHHIRALEIRLEIYDHPHLEIANSYNNLGIAYGYLGKTLLAHTNIKKALDCFVEIYGEKHPRTALIYANLGTACSNLGNATEALEYHTIALDIRLKIYVPTHHCVKDSYDQLLVAYEKFGIGNNQKMAYKYLKKARIFYENIGDKTSLACVLKHLLQLEYASDVSAVSIRNTKFAQRKEKKVNVPESSIKKIISILTSGTDSKMKENPEGSEECAEGLAKAVSLSLVEQPLDDQYSIYAKVEALISKDEDSIMHCRTSEEIPPQTNTPSSLPASPSPNTSSPLTSPGSSSLFASAIRQPANTSATPIQKIQEIELKKEHTVMGSILIKNISQSDRERLGKLLKAIEEKHGFKIIGDITCRAESTHEAQFSKKLSFINAFEKYGDKKDQFSINLSYETLTSTIEFEGDTVMYEFTDFSCKVKQNEPIAKEHQDQNSLAKELPPVCAIS